VDKKRIVKFKLKFSQRYIAFVNYETLVFPIDGYMKQFYCTVAKLGNAGLIRTGLTLMPECRFGLP
jgi:hypothetical protein